MNFVHIGSSSNNMYHPLATLIINRFIINHLIINHSSFHRLIKKKILPHFFMEQDFFVCKLFVQRYTNHHLPHACVR